jgi:hypothetical protein
MSTPFTSPLLMYTLRATEFHPLLQHAVHNDEHLVGDRYDGAFFPSARRQSLESDGKHGALLASRSPGTLHQVRAQIGIPMGSLATLLNAGAFPIPRTRPAQLANCSALGNGDKSVPVSARIAAAERRPTPGTVCSKTKAAANGGVCIRRRISSSNVSISSCKHPKCRRQV